MALFELTELASWVQSDLDTATATLAREQATTYLEAETGVSLTRQEDVTVAYSPRWNDCWIDLPVPTTAVSSVAVDGSTLGVNDYQFVRDLFRLYRRVGWGGWSYQRSLGRAMLIEDDYVSVDVTMTYGFATPPAEFKTWGLILAAQAYQLMPSLNRQSVRIDDFAETFATGGELAAMGIGMSPKALGMLKSRYGRGAVSVAAR